MKFIISSIILLAFLTQYSYTQFVMELNSCVTTELTSSSNGRIGEWHWQGWACGINGTVIKSIGASNNWRNVSGNGIPSNVSLDNICGLDSTIAFVAGHLNANTWVWKTTNGGQNWFQVFTQPNGRINAVWMRSQQQGFMQGNPVNGRWSLWKTTNGGSNWDSAGLFLIQAGSELGWPNSFCMRLNNYYPENDSNKIWFGTNNYRIYYSSNYGQSWNIQALPSEQNIFCIAYGRDYTGIYLYAGGSSKLFKSTNYGTNWVTDSVGGSGAIKGVTYAAWSFYLVRENKVFYKGFSGSWYQCYAASAGNYNYLDNRGFGLWYDHYAVRTNGGITFICEGEGVQKISSEIPNSFSLSQNYPNPFNPVTKIKFDVPLDSRLRGNDNVTLKIYDILGKEIATLVNEELSPGTYEVEWDGKNYPSGVYFYKLITESNSETRKLVLIK